MFLWFFGEALLHDRFWYEMEALGCHFCSDARQHVFNLISKNLHNLIHYSTTKCKIKEKAAETICRFTFHMDHHKSQLSSDFQATSSIISMGVTLIKKAYSSCKYHPGYGSTTRTPKTRIAHQNGSEMALITIWTSMVRK